MSNANEGSFFCKNCCSQHKLSSHHCPFFTNKWLCPWCLFSVQFLLSTNLPIWWPKLRCPQQLIIWLLSNVGTKDCGCKHCGAFSLFSIFCLPSGNPISVLFLAHKCNLPYPVCDCSNSFLWKNNWIIYLNIFHTHWVIRGKLKFSQYAFFVWKCEHWRQINFDVWEGSVGIIGGKWNVSRHNKLLRFARNEHQ